MSEGLAAYSIGLAPIFVGVLLVLVLFAVVQVFEALDRHRRGRKENRTTSSAVVTETRLTFKIELTDAQVDEYKKFFLKHHEPTSSTSTS